MCEYAWCSIQQPAKIFKYSVLSGDKKIHPTQKPCALYDWIFARYAHKGDKILDTHLGSGSSRIAAWQAGYNFLGTEIDADYFKAQEERYASYAAQYKLF
jgi:site-specific DNA-methyltransferase (adenine-specific)